MAAVAMRIGGAALAAMMAALLSAQPAQAGYIVTLEQVGSDVVATGGGFIDLDGLTFFNNEAPSAAIFPSIAEIITGPTAPTALEVYQGFSGPQNFGGGSLIFANSGRGDSVALDGRDSLLAVPQGFDPDNALSDISTYSGQTFSSLGVTPGTYEWTWGTGPNQNFTLIIGEVPEPSTWAMMLLGFAGLGYVGYRRSSKLQPVTV
jgi:PEP-CTERM motif